MWAKTSHSHGKATGNSLGGPDSWVGERPQNHQGRAYSVSQVDGVSDMVPTFQLCGSVKGGLIKGTMASASISV